MNVALPGLSLRGPQRSARSAMKQARTVEEWRAAAHRLDSAEGNDAWKLDDRSDDYDWRVLQARLKTLRSLMRSGDTDALVHFLRQGLHWNLAGSGNPALYAYSHVGTKVLIETFVDTVCEALEDIAALPSHKLSKAAKVAFFQEASTSYGRSALMLSGGATLGLFHIGVIKALWEADLLPSVISGSSAGSLVAATLGTRTDEELVDIFSADMAHFSFWRGLTLGSMVRRRALMDQAQVRRGINHHVENLTFKQAYEKTGRIINITVSSTNMQQSPKLLNYLTFPDLYVREAVLASCAVPFVFEPVTLYTRDEHGRKVPFMPSAQWVDGSMKSDLPRLRLRRLHNVNHFVVCQTNPHVMPFMQVRGKKRRGLLNASRHYALLTVKEQAKLAAAFARDVSGSGVLGRRLDDLHGILEQDYRGHVTVVPPLRFARYFQMAANPTLDETREFILHGERAAWPHLSMIRNQTRISRTFDECLTRVTGASKAPTRAVQLEQIG